MLALVSELSGRTLSPRVYEVAAGLLVFYSMFLAWRDEHNAAEQERRRPMTDPVAILLSRHLNESSARRTQEEHASILREIAQEIRADRLQSEWKPNIAIECRGFTLFGNQANPNSAILAVEVYVTNTGAPTALHEWELRYHFRDHILHGVASQPLRMHADVDKYQNIARMETPVEQLRTGALIANIYHENIGRGETLAEIFIFCTEILTGKVHRVDFSKGSPSLAHPLYQ